MGRVPIDTDWSLTPATAGALVPCHSISTITPGKTGQPARPDPEGGVTDVTTATKVNIKPLEDRVVVQANEAETTTASGLVIPDTAKEKPQEGTVIAVGPGRIDDNGNRVPLDVNVGDVVIYSKYGGTEVRYGGEEYLVLSARDLLAVVEK
jgi:chaperonin GroES